MSSERNATNNSREARTQIRPRGAARSARHPVTVEIVGSNPIGDAEELSVESPELRELLSTLNSGLSTQYGTVAQLAEASGLGPEG